MSDVEPEEILALVNAAEVIGAWKVLNWLSFEFHENMTVKDIVETVDYTEAIFREKLWDDFNRQHCIITHLEDRIKKRKEEEGSKLPTEVKSTVTGNQESKEGGDNDC